MFGHQDETDNATTGQPGSAGTVSGSFGDDTASSATDWNLSTANPPTPTVVSSNDDDQLTPLLEPDADEDQPASPSASNEPAVSPASTSSSSVTATGPRDDLLNIKQQALQQLSPLVGQLDQSAEEKFRTTMMMIQASDNQTLLKDAFAAAQQISDDKQRAQALLDVINEINYFTQQAS